jgi:poly [ADP-ribose] polymerase
MPKATKAKAGKDLTGACFCITGKLSMSRAALTTAIKARGGDVAGSVTAKVTHVLSTPTEVTGGTSKIIQAQGKGLPIISEDFLDACKKAKKIAPTKKFEIGGAAKPAAKKPAAKKPSAKKAPAKKKAAPKKKKAAAAPAGPVVHPKAPMIAAESEVFVDENDRVYEAELNQQEVATNTDKFYILQLLQDGDAYYLFQHWGRTGTTGQVKTDDFDDEDQAIASFEAKFKSKTGAKWESVYLGRYQQKKGKYNYLAKDYALSRDEEVLWQYDLTNDPHGKPDGWYSYDGDATTEDSAIYNMENYHEQFLSNSWLDIRFVTSGQYTYKVDFGQMQQTNTTSNKSRPIRRHH